jgi:hypothetical protein
MQQPKVPSQNTFLIGSPTRSVQRLSLLFMSFVVALLLVYWWLAKLTDSPLVVLVVVAVLTVIRRALHVGAEWATFITKDAAYGRVIESGIQYRALHRDHFVAWPQIERLEYFADSGRINMYLCGENVPVQFAPRKGQLPPTSWPSVPAGLREHIYVPHGCFPVTRTANTPQIIQSRRDSAIRLATMIVVGLALLVALFQLIERWVGNSTIALLLLMGSLVMALFDALVFGRIPRWIDSVMKDVRNLRAQ